MRTEWGQRTPTKRQEPEWTPFHEAIVCTAPPLEATEAKGGKPVSWRCPDCEGPVVRTFFGPATTHGDPTEEEFIRADFRCRSATCGWADWILWPA